MKKIYALRGAVCVQNTKEDVSAQTGRLYSKLLSANALSEADVVSIIFSITPDINAKNPCTALREAGFAKETPLFAVQEAQTEGMMNNTIRTLIHCYLEEDSKPVHIYTNGAEALRPDRGSK
ncbi:MAG: chorismate mutase [Spirochaetaceae bacterium]|jgi:chorismate mutase|nr:chorismate mutase [Spirochaetaceae bacterium]